MRKSRYGDALSRREQQVWALKQSGMTHPQIADALYISKRTVDTHVAAINIKQGRGQWQRRKHGAMVTDEDFAILIDIVARQRAHQRVLREQIAHSEEILRQSWHPAWDAFTGKKLAADSPYYAKGSGMTAFTDLIEARITELESGAS